MTTPPPTVEGAPLVKTMGRLTRPMLATVESLGSDLFELEWQAQMAPEHPNLVQDMLVHASDDEQILVANVESIETPDHRDDPLVASENPQDQIVERQSGRAFLTVANNSAELSMSKSGIQPDVDELAVSPLSSPKSPHKTESIREPFEQDSVMHAKTILTGSVPENHTGHDRSQTGHQLAEKSQRTELPTRLGISDSGALQPQKPNWDVWQRMPLAERSISHELSADKSDQAKIQPSDLPHSNRAVSEHLFTDATVSRPPERTSLPQGVIEVAQGEMAHPKLSKHMDAYAGARSDQRTYSHSDVPEANVTGANTASLEGGERVRVLSSKSPNPIGPDFQIGARSVFEPVAPEDAARMADFSVAEGRGSAPVSNISAPMTVATTPARVVSQVVDVIHNTTESALEVTLKPEELGKVRLTFLPSETGLHVTVLADRPETLDLMRRHFDLLESELRALGYEGVSLSFGEGEARSEADQNNQPASSVSETAAEVASLPEVTSYHLTAGLDIRI